MNGWIGSIATKLSTSAGIIFFVSLCISISVLSLYQCIISVSVYYLCIFVLCRCAFSPSFIGEWMVGLVQWMGGHVPLIVGKIPLALCFLNFFIFASCSTLQAVGPLGSIPLMLTSNGFFKLKFIFSTWSSLLLLLLPAFPPMDGKPLLHWFWEAATDNRYSKPRP